MSWGTELRVPAATQVTVTEDALVAELADGRTVSVPLSWYPRLAHGNLLAGKRLGESQRSFERWLELRRGNG